MVYAIVYARVSTDMQKESSLKTQSAVCIDWCLKKGITNYIVESDIAVSGTSLKGRKIEECIDQVDKGGYLVFYDVSRLVRNESDYYKLKDLMNSKGIKHVFAMYPQFDPNTKEGSLMIHSILGIAAYAVKSTRENVSKTMQQMVKEGKIMGRVGYGKKRLSSGSDKIADSLVDDNEELEVLKAIGYFRSIGKDGVPMPYSEIAKILNDSGIPSPSAKIDKSQKKLRITEWNHRSVKRVFERFLLEHPVKEAFEIPPMDGEYLLISKARKQQKEVSMDMLKQEEISLESLRMNDPRMKEYIKECEDAELNEDEIKDLVRKKLSERTNSKQKEIDEYRIKLEKIGMSEDKIEQKIKTKFNIGL